MQLELLETAAPVAAAVPVLPESIMREIETAYADCMSPEDSGPKYRKAMTTRQLQFLASRAVSPEQAAKIMEKVLRNSGGSYNAFTPDLLLQFPADSMIRIGREGSVCVYVWPREQPLPSKEALLADEYTWEACCWWDKENPFVNKALRVWWD